VGKGEDESKSSEAGEWGIRHGFETQLVSEEYNSFLNAVWTFPCALGQADLTFVELLPLLHRQKARDRRQSQV
jgi:hypothetical protein